MLDSEGWAQQHVKPARMSMKRMSSLRRSWVFCNELSTKICATERTAMIVPWHVERTRTGAFVILPADELLSAIKGLTLTGKKRRQCELPMTTDFDAPLRTQTIIERFSKPNFGSIRRFRTMTGLEIENWIEKRGRTVRKFRSTRPRTESDFRFGLTSCRSQNLPTEVRSLLCQVFDSFSLVTSSSSHHASHLRGFIRSNKAKLKNPFN